MGLHANNLAAKRAELAGRLGRGLQGAEEVLQEWNRSTWMRPLHLFGLLCQEDRRRFFALKLLQLLGCGAEVEEEYERLLPGSASGAQKVRELQAKADMVDKVLEERLEAHHGSGDLTRVMKVRLRPMSRWSSERAFKHLGPAAGAEKLGLIKYNYGLIMD